MRFVLPSCPSKDNHSKLNQLSTSFIELTSCSWFFFNMKGLKSFFSNHKSPLARNKPLTSWRGKNSVFPSNKKSTSLIKQQPQWRKNFGKEAKKNLFRKTCQERFFSEPASASEFSAKSKLFLLIRCFERVWAQARARACIWGSVRSFWRCSALPRLLPLSINSQKTGSKNLLQIDSVGSKETLFGCLVRNNCNENALYLFNHLKCIFDLKVGSTSRQLPGLTWEDPSGCTINLCGTECSTHHACKAKR